MAMMMTWLMTCVWSTCYVHTSSCVKCESEKCERTRQLVIMSQFRPALWSKNQVKWAAYFFRLFSLILTPWHLIRGYMVRMTPNLVKIWPLTRQLWPRFVTHWEVVETWGLQFWKAEVKGFPMIPHLHRVIIKSNGQKWRIRHFWLPITPNGGSWWWIRYMGQVTQLTDHTGTSRPGSHRIPPKKNWRSNFAIFLLKKIF